MSKSRPALLQPAALVLLSVLVGSTAAVAQTAKPATTQAQPPLRIAVLSMQRIYQESTAGKSLYQKLGELEKKYRADIAGRQEKVRQEEADLARQQSVLSPEAFEEKRRSYQRDVSDLQQMLQDRNADLDLIEKKGTAEIKAALLTILKQFQPERGFQLLIEGQTTISYDPAIDVTNELLERLNKALPAVKVSASDLDARGAGGAKKAPAAE